MTGETSKTLVFTDTNIWLYTLLDKQDPKKASIANQLLDQHIGNLVLSSQVVVEVVANLIKKSSLGEKSIISFVQDVYRDHAIIETGQMVMIEASQLRTRYALSYWDSLIVAAALQSGASILYSEDMHHRLVVENQLTIVNPFV